MIRVTYHAITRAMERIPGVCTEDQARALLSTKAIAAAANFGAKYVRLGTGQRIVIEEGSVITVLPADTQVWKMGHTGDRIRQHARGWAKFEQQGAH